ncbi:MAG TPA: 4Fe-4S dicluster domain-containing protein [Symbiobacteriaceae bacterium]|nr:4Fe-4S dicluster domain-containing protein [Symbiobacteriaceae bacterium]
MSKGMLIDLSKCMGCRGCQVACKQWNDLPGEQTTVGTEFTNPQNRTAYTWTIVEFMTAERNGKTVSSFTKTQCMHCLEPACVSVCIGGALHKTETGAVVNDYDKCIGCRYCLLACPFGVPKYEFDKSVPKMQKCTMCYDRIENGWQPACAATCPSNAIIFGERDELLAIARKRIASGGDKYVNHIYGEHEAGGTNVLYISSVPLDLTALRQGVTEESVPSFTWKAMKQIPYMLGAVGTISLGLLAYSNRRSEIEAANRKEGAK